MARHPFHSELLLEIKARSGKPTHHTFLDSYLGNSHPRYPINMPTLRQIGKDFMKSHRDLTASEFGKLLTSLAGGKSSTEKTMVGILLDYSAREQRKFNPALFDRWLNHLVGWAEIDAVCTGKYMLTEVPAQWPAWKKLTDQFSRSGNINKRRASLVTFCQPLRKVKHPAIQKAAFRMVSRLCGEKEVLITKAISWVLRCSIPLYATEVRKFVNVNEAKLPAIAVRETRAVLLNGRKTVRSR